MAHVQVLLCQVGDEAYEVTLPTTFAREFAEWLPHAAAEFGCAVD